MTTTANLTKHKLQTGDFIGLPVLASRVDDNDDICWLTITGVVRHEGYRCYETAFPNGEKRRTLIRANSVQFWRTN